MKIFVILGHPSRKRVTFCEALANAYAEGAKGAGHEVILYKIADKQFDPVLHEGYGDVPPPEPDIADARAKVAWAEHIVLVYPLWEFMIPALLKGFLERLLILGGTDPDPAKKVFKLTGKTARIVQTSGMPGFFYRFYYGAHGTKALKDLLNFSGVASTHASYYGLVEGRDAAYRQKLLEEVKKLGSRGR
jgi:NAD(P)H dehydrogenase (quinone)